MDLAQKLEDRYQRLVSDLENTDAGGVIHQSTLVHKGYVRDTLTGPLGVFPIDLGVRAGSTTNNSTVLVIDAAEREDFAELTLYSRTTPGIYQDWNVNSSDGVPQHAEDATRVGVFQYKPASIKLTDLDPETLYYFVVVIHTTTGKYYYSNEVVVETTA